MTASSTKRCTASDVDGAAIDTNTSRPSDAAVRIKRHHVRRDQVVDHQHVGALTKRGTRRGERFVGAAANLALADERRLVVVDQANLPFQRDHELGALAVDQVDERRHQRRLAAGARAGDEHEALRFGGERLHFAREAQLLRGRGARGDHPQHQAGTAMIGERGAANAAELRVLLEPLGGLAHRRSFVAGLGSNFDDRRFDVGARQHRFVLELADVAVDAHVRTRL